MPPPLPRLDIINPVSSAQRSIGISPADIEGLVSAQLFGAPGTTLSPEELQTAVVKNTAMSEVEAAQKLAGIEDGAPETRLALLLRGVVASSEAGLGQAVIEHSKQQDLYQVGDELPAGNAVSLAKVLPSLVVLDNGGRYEVLRLFEEGDLSRLNPSASQVSASLDVQTSARTRTADTASAESVPGDTRAAAELAAEYRDRLYRDPQSLADVVRVSPARVEGQLLGYRLAPGAAAQEFSTLGFKSGDVVTAVNGLALSDASNFPRLLSAMRSAEAVSFDIERAGQDLTLTVDIGLGGDSGR